MLIAVPHSGDFQEPDATDDSLSNGQLKKGDEDPQEGQAGSSRKRTTHIMLVRVVKKRKPNTGPSDENLAAVEASRVALSSSPRLSFTSHSSCSEIHAWLSHLNSLHASSMYIHPVLVSYTDSKRKRNELKRISRGTLPEPFKSTELADWKLPGTLTSAVLRVLNSGTIFLFSAPIWNPVQLKKLERAAAFHTYTVLYKNRTLVIADPGYEWEPLEKDAKGQKRNWKISELTFGCGLARKFVEFMRDKDRRVDKCWYGKGLKDSEIVYDDTNGNVISQEFILEYLDKWAGKEIDWEKEEFLEISL